MTALNSKRITSAVLSLTLILGGLTGCGDSEEITNAKAVIESGGTLGIQVHTSDGQVMANPSNITEWIRVADNRSHQSFRLEFDSQLNTNTITKIDGNNTKQSSAYTAAGPDGDAQYSNTCMRDAIRNKKFYTEYWSDSRVLAELHKSIAEIYTDIQTGSSQSKRAMLNSYFDIYNEEENDTTYNPDLVLTREEFYALAYKAGHGLNNYLKDSGYEDYISQVNGTEFFNQFSYYFDNYALLNTNNGGITSGLLKLPITKMEALYMVSKYYFGYMASGIELSGTAFGLECQDVALDCGVKYKDKETKEIVTRDYLEYNTFAYMTIAGNEAGIDQTFFPYIKVAEKGGLASGIDTSDLYAPITKDEAIALMMNVFIAETSVNGYLTTSEYPSESLDGTEYDTSGLVEIRTSNFTPIEIENVEIALAE